MERNHLPNDRYKCAAGDSGKQIVAAAAAANTARMAVTAYNFPSSSYIYSMSRCARVRRQSSTRYPNHSVINGQLLLHPWILNLCESYVCGGKIVSVMRCILLMAECKWGEKDCSGADFCGNITLLCDFW